MFQSLTIYVVEKENTNNGPGCSNTMKLLLRRTLVRFVILLSIKTL